MKRKVIQLSEKTLVVSLPTEWIRSQNVEKGAELDCVIQDYKIIFSPQNNRTVLNSIELDVKGISDRVLRWQISSLHKQGYDEIIILNYTDKHYEIIEDLVKHLFVGFIIKEQSQLRIKIGSVAMVDASEFDSTLRRAFRLVDEVFSDLHIAFKNKDKELLARQINHEHINNQLTNFCECLLNKNLSQKDKGHFWYVVSWNLEKIVDNPKYIASYYLDKTLDVTDETLSLLQEIRDYANLWYDLFYNFSFEKLVKLNSKKKELDALCLGSIINMPENDRVLIHYLHLIVLQFADFSASTIAVRFNPN
ncbi:hypothetical protein JXA48_04350 [Candidatus Woesearchaeota archaeon]|nr:hypothetical protein [Candidatus Woesearchaeota archaeon]